MPVRLHINIDHVATVRNARGAPYPDPTFAAMLCEQAGADGITAHLREDRRHIRDDDIVRLRERINTVLNLEIAATPEMLAIAEKTLPAIITLVPERREERTTEGGLNLKTQAGPLREAIAMARKNGIVPSLFVAPNVEDMDQSAELGAQQVELHTGEYCHAMAVPTNRAKIQHELERLRTASTRARALGLAVAAGHGLTQHNLRDVIAIPEVEEVNIGHAVIADAIFEGLPNVVRAFRRAIDRGLALRDHG